MPSKSRFPQSCVSSVSSLVGLMVTSSRRAYAIPKSAAPRTPPLQQSTADPYLHRRHSNTVLFQSLWGLWVLVCTRLVWALWVPLAGMGFDAKLDFVPPTIFLGLLCPWMWDISSQSLQYWAMQPSIKVSKDMGSQKSQRRLSNRAALIACSSLRVCLCALPHVLCFSHMYSPPF